MVKKAASRHMRGLLSTVFLLFFSASIAVQAAVYLKIDGIDGESRAVDYEDWLTALTWQWCATADHSEVGSGRTSGRATVEDFTFERVLDTGSPYLMRAVLTGTNLGRVEIEFTDEIGGIRQAYMKILLTDAVVTKHALDADGQQRPRETLSLRFSAITFTYIQFSEDGSAADEHEITYDIAAGV